MRARLGFFLVVAALAAWPAETAVMQQHASVPVLAVRAQDGALHPGDVGVLIVTGPRNLATVAGEAFGRPVRFWAAGGGQWHGLVGLALDTAPGTYDVTVRGTTSDGTAAEAATQLVVAAKRFETRRLRVASEFVDPPADEIARIQSDATLMAAIFAESAPERLWRGSFATPVGGTATSSFGRLSVLNGQPNGRHQGADFRAKAGTPIHAPNAGRIVLAENLYFAGNTVIIDHGLGLFSLFAHLSRTDVVLGQRVDKLDVIGLAGATGRVTGPHVHWAVRMEAFSVDPMSLMAAVETLPEADEILSTR